MAQAGSSIGAIISPPPSGPPYPPGFRSRSPPGSDKGGAKPLADLAHQGKKGLNQLITFLDQASRTERSGSGSLKEGQERANNGLRSVRAKREADEAGLCLFDDLLAGFEIRTQIRNIVRACTGWKPYGCEE